MSIVIELGHIASSHSLMGGSVWFVYRVAIFQKRWVLVCVGTITIPFQLIILDFLNSIFYFGYFLEIPLFSQLEF
jgi:hypothetical protein